MAPKITANNDLERFVVDLTNESSDTSDASDSDIAELPTNLNRLLPSFKQKQALSRLQASRTASRVASHASSETLQGLINEVVKTSSIRTPKQPLPLRSLPRPHSPFGGYLSPSVGNNLAKDRGVSASESSTSKTLNNPINPQKRKAKDAGLSNRLHILPPGISAASKFGGNGHLLGGATDSAGTEDGRVIESTTIDLDRIGNVGLNLPESKRKSPPLSAQFPKAKKLKENHGRSDLQSLLHAATIENHGRSDIQTLLQAATIENAHYENLEEQDQAVPSPQTVTPNNDHVFSGFDHSMRLAGAKLLALQAISTASEAASPSRNNRVQQFQPSELVPSSPFPIIRSEDLSLRSTTLQASQEGPSFPSVDPQVQSSIVPNRSEKQFSPQPPSQGIFNVGDGRSSNNTTYPNRTIPSPSVTLPSPSSNFEASVMPNRQGMAFTNEELIMVGYLNEERNVSWKDTDRRMGRNTNSCATKYLRKPRGLKSPFVKIEWNYYDRIAALHALIVKLDPSIEQAVNMLEQYITSGCLPASCQQLYADLRASAAPLHSVTPQSLPVSSNSPSLANIQRDGAFPLRSSQVAPIYVPESGDAVTTNVVQRNLRPGARKPQGDYDVLRNLELIEDDSGITLPVESTHEPDFDQHLADATDSSLAPVNLPEGSFLKRQKPYLRFVERTTLGKTMDKIAWHPEDIVEWDGVSLHVDLSDQELEDVLLVVCARLRRSRYSAEPQTVLERIQSLTQNLSDPKIHDIAGHAKSSGYLEDRTSRSVESFLRDVASGHLTQKTSLSSLRMRAPLKKSVYPISSKLLRREYGEYRQQQKIQDIIYDSVNTTLAYTGASGDVGTLAWAPDGVRFAAGAACLVDNHSMQYNRPNNLLFGNVREKALFELPDHARPRERTATGVNATHAMHVSQDSRLFETVSMVDFAHDGSFLFSAGYDNTVRAYEMQGWRSPPKLKWECDQGSKLDLLTANRFSDLVAFGCRSSSDCIKVYSHTLGRFEETASFGPLHKAHQHRPLQPACLRWGTHQSVRNHLLAGFFAASDDGGEVYGETCLWDVERNVSIQVLPYYGSVFDCNWSPAGAIFATACSAYGPTMKRGTHSFIRLYDKQCADRWSKVVELDCPARDVNDVLFCPQNENYVTAGCTDGKIYVWDIRQPESMLHTFQHGPAVVELEHDTPHDMSDTGVRFCAWNQNPSRLYTGSSDGVLKAWDMFRAPEDAHVSDVATFNSGIYSGAFSPDFTSLLVGEFNGSINVLEVGAEERPRKEVEKFQFYKADSSETTSSTLELHADSGIEASRELCVTKQIEIRPFGGFPVRQAVQGEKYDGPFDKSDVAFNLRALACEFQRRIKPANPDKQCQLPLCRTNAALRVTAEEEGDTGRAADRIPQALRELRAESKMVPGMKKCTNCDAPARPRPGDAEQEHFPLCERCGFSCFRCGERAKIRFPVETFSCRSCGLKWDIGALGYQLQGEKGTIKSGKSRVVPRRMLEDGGVGDLERTIDLLHLVEEQDHSLWEDRASSPL